VQYDSVNAVWCAEAPVNGKTIVVGATPDEAINKLGICCSICSIKPST
jgi:hypothetical protein